MTKTQLLLRLLLAVVVMSANPVGASDRPEVSLLPEECESALALAAAPEHLRDGAAVFALTAKGYREVRKGDNGFLCIVNRDHPRVLKPTCFDAEGARTIVPKIVRVGELLLDGASQAEIRSEVERGFAQGRFQSPARPGVAYMLSHYNRPYDPGRDRLGWFPPHVMFYAPNLTNEDIGFDPSTYGSDPLLPFIGYQGPHGFMIVRSAEAVDPESHPVPSCPDWVGADPPR